LFTIKVLCILTGEFGMANSVFTPEYTKNEVEWYGVQKFDGHNVKVSSRLLQRELNEYLNTWWWLGELECPSFFIKEADGWRCWMSLTPLEVQSMALPLHYAEGAVGTSGLGMGYFALSAAQSGAVDQVDVYESNPHVIRFFKKKFKDREGYDKINIIEGDVYDNLKGKYYDFFFADHYPTIGSDDVVTDWETFNRDNDIGIYRFWGLEKVLCQVLMDQLDEENRDFDWLDCRERFFFTDWLNAERDLGSHDMVAIHTMYRRDYDSDYVRSVLEVAGLVDLVPISV